MDFRFNAVTIAKLVRPKMKQ